MRALQARLGYEFKDKALLERALTHKSRGDGQPGFMHNERLEWLGDRVLGLMAAERLFHMYARAEEGELTRQFNAIVSGKNCAQAARELDLTHLVEVSRGLSADAVAESDSILGDAFEALMAALWLDGGRHAVEGLFELVWVSGQTPSSGSRNPKSALQEWAQKRGLSTPFYKVVERDGPDHAPRFVVEVKLGTLVARAQGSSKQNAERAAALALLKQGGLGV
ncbi:ribonuclease 3 [Candidatus Phycosocius spiralis]|uniref:Ribonuclease 3 n=2 Tax=Candidatus Phycosocius spiralis TaxID=2815099 RepID=A0ABQ4PS71_9PROT|nr:ribonuclease 3 [Candidatus Phycosocius spiralis]